MTYLAVPIAAQDLRQAQDQIRAAKAGGAELIELRTDYIKALSVDLVKELIGIAKAGDLPVIVTCRDKRQGGIIDYPQQLRVDVICGAIEAGAEFVDFEYENFLIASNQEKINAALAKKPGCRVILSAHDFEGKFSDIDGLYQDILNAFPASIPKLIYKAGNINDCFEAFDLLHKTSGRRIVFCMGQAGLITRVLAKKFGTFLTFASIDRQKATAPGQLTIEQFRQLYRWDSIGSDTELFGVIAYPVGHSLSPAVHNGCFADMNMNRLYLPLLVQAGKADFDLFMDNVISRDSLGFKGFSVTIPHKENALNYVITNDGFVEPLAEKIKAANTLLIEPRATDKQSRLKAYNTDYSSALDAVTSALSKGREYFNNLSVAVIGAGGVARAVVAGLADAGAKIRIYNRTVGRAERLAAEFGCDFAPLQDLSSLKAELVINCTSIGMHPNVDASAVPKQYLKKDMVVFDTVYNPQQTLLLKNAEDAGAKTVDGISMFVNQALAQFKLFTSRNANAELMRKTITACLSSQ